MNEPDAMPITRAVVGEVLGPVDVTVDEATLATFVTRAALAETGILRGKDGERFLPGGTLGEAYTRPLDAARYYYLDALQLRHEERHFRPIVVGEALTCRDTILEAGTTRSGLSYVDIEAVVTDAGGNAAFISRTRLAVEASNE